MILAAIMVSAATASFAVRGYVHKSDERLSASETRTVNVTVSATETETSESETTHVEQTAPPSTASVNETYRFADTAFLGNSRFISIKDNGLARNVYPVVGLDVRTVFTKYVTGSNVRVIDELNGKDFDKVVLMFGDNECGWPNTDYFIEKYSNVIDAVRERCPDAEIYLHAIIPVSAEMSEKNECGCNNERISYINGRIKQLAEEKNAKYIEQPACLMDSHGDLITEAASDGVHLNRRYTERWIDYLEKVIY